MDSGGETTADDDFLSTLSVETGQRKYGPPADWQGEPPGKGCEVFLAKLPRDLSDSSLWRLARRPGRAHELRVMTEPGGRSRGYAFVVYADKETAKRAVAELHNERVGEQRIGATISVDNRRLFVGGLARDKSRAQVLAELRPLLPDVVDVIMYPSAHDKSKNRGFAFVELPSHRAAALARQRLTRDRVALFGQPICVDWAEPELDVDEDTMKQVRILYLRNLMLCTNEETLWRLFDGYAPGAVERVKKIKDFAFVHFQSREAAETALEKAQDVEIDGARPEVMWARPPDRSFMRHVRDTMRSASSKPSVLPVASNVHQSIVLAAAAAAAANHQQNGGKQPAPATAAALLSQRGAGAHGALDADAATLWAYCGVPLIELPDDDAPPDDGRTHRQNAGVTRSVAGGKRSAGRTGREPGSGGQRKRAIAAVSYGPLAPAFVQPMIAGQGALPVPVATALLTPHQMANLAPNWALGPPPPPLPPPTSVAPFVQHQLLQQQQHQQQLQQLHAAQALAAAGAQMAAGTGAE